jgi:hypothetical protein
MMTKITSGVKDILYDRLLSYAIALDTKSYRLLTEVFHEDVRADHSPLPIINSRQELINLMDRLHSPLIGSLHRLSNFSVSSVASPTSVSTRSYVDAVLLTGSGVESTVTRDLGTYLDIFECREGNWKIAPADMSD